MSGGNGSGLEMACEEILSHIDDRERVNAVIARFPGSRDRAELFDRLSRKIFPATPGSSLKASRACIILAESLADAGKLYFAHVWHGYACLYAGMAGEARSAAGRLPELLSAMGIGTDQGLPCSSPFKDAFLLSARLETNDGFTAERQGLAGLAREHYGNALKALLQLKPDDKESDAWYRVMLGDTYGYLGEHERAVASYESALQYRGFPAVANLQGIYSSLGDSYLALGNSTGAERHYGLAMEAARAAGDDEAESLGHLSLAGLYFKSLNLLDKALAQATLAIETAKDPLNRVTGLQQKGAVCFAMGRYRDALGCYQEAAETASRAGDAVGGAFIRSAAASVLSLMGRHEEALVVLKGAQALFDEHGLKPSSIRTMFEISLCHDSLGDCGSALEVLDRARDAATAIGEVSLEAVSLVQKGNIYLYHTHSLREAYKCFNEAFRLSHGQEGPGDKAVKVRALTGLSAIYMRMGDPDNALHYEESALEACKGDPSLSPTMASLYTDVAGMLAAAGRPEDARRSVRDALETYQSIGMRRQIADTYRDSALLLADMGDPVEALRHCDEAIAIYRETGVPAEAVLPHNIAALVLYKAGRADEAMARLEMAVSAGEGQAIDPSLLATAYTGLGFLCEKTGDSRRALSSFVAAIDLLDSVRASLATGDLKLDFQGQERNLYSAAVKAFQVAGDAGMAFRYAEKAKSRVLLEQLRMTPLARPLSVDDRLAAREEALIDELNAAIRDGGPGGRSRDLERELDGLWRTMERSMPSSAGLKEYLSLRRGDSIGAGDLASYLTMTRFYEAYVTEKADKANALRAAQLFVRDLTIDDLLRYGESEAERKQLLDALGPAADNPGARPFCHPYYWSPFVLAGDWKSSGQRVLINSGKPPIRNISAGRWARSTSCWLAVKP